MLDSRTTIYHQVADVVLAIEAEMRRTNLWENTSPPQEHLNSLLPFCCDKLMINQWLQWVFLPQISTILERGLPLPEFSDIFPYAEELLSNYDYDMKKLLTLLKQFDERISGQNK